MQKKKEKKKTEQANPNPGNTLFCGLLGELNHTSTITYVPLDDRTVESKSCDGSNTDIDNSAFIVFNNEQGKEAYEKEMNRVDHEVENNFVEDKLN
eukprot:12956562-Ditylum_brightwellii.AAC.1